MGQMIHTMEIQRSFLADEKWEVTWENILGRKNVVKNLDWLSVIFIAYSKETSLFKRGLIINQFSMGTGNRKSIMFLKVNPVEISEAVWRLLVW